VLRLYDRLLQSRDDPIVRVNRAVAVAEIEGADAALAELARLDFKALDDFLPYHAVRADLLRRTGNRIEAAAAYSRALRLDPPAAERRWLERKLAELPQS
jgi:RNA polymerase sigma-70 factor (ECF subfamily)